MLDLATFGPIYQGQRYWPGRYVLTTTRPGHVPDDFRVWYWTGRCDREGKPVVTLDPEHARSFVSARHAYESARGMRQLQHWRAKRLNPQEALA